jgi:hypothetical protein
MNLALAVFFFGATVHDEPWPLLRLPAIVKGFSTVQAFHGGGGAVNHTPNPQPRGPGSPFLSGSSPLTCPSRETLPAATLPPG